MNWRRRVDKELQFHLDEHVRDLIASGCEPEEARRQARIALGGPEQVKEYCGDARGLRWLENLWLDLRYALRTYRRSPGFTLTALLAIAVGIGATSAVFSVTDRILFRHLPFTADEQLVSAGMVAKVVDEGEFLFAADYKDLSSGNTPFQAITSWSGVSDCDINEPNPIRQRCAEVDWNFLDVLGVRPVLGGTFTRADVQPGAPASVVLGYGLWQSHFGGDRSISGKTLTLDGAPARILGVLPASFELPTLQHADMLTPQIVTAGGWQHGATRVLRSVGRLKDGVTLEAARAQLTPVFDHMLSYVPPQFRKEVQYRVRSVRDRQMGDAQLAAWTLLGAVITVMLISCANVANLLLARMAGRQTELAIREAIGISRGRLLCQMLTESLLLALSGGVLGCALGALMLRLLVAANKNGIPHLEDASLDGRVLAFSMGLALLAGLVFGLAPAFQRPLENCLGSARGVAPRASTTLKNMLVAAQIALSIVLLAGAGLLTRSLWNLETQALGMSADHVLTVQMALPAARYAKPEERISFFNQVEEKLRAIPGMRAVGLSDSLPPGGWERSRPLFSLVIAGQAQNKGGTGGLVNWRYVSPDYFEALHIPVLAGRRFGEGDRRPENDLCILSQSLARRLFGSQNAVGQHLQFVTGPLYEIVGVAPDVKNTGLPVAGNPEYYVLRTHSVDDIYVNGTGPVAQRTLSVVLRSSIPDDELAMQVKRRIADVDATQPVEIQSMRERLSGLSAGPRFYAVLLLAFAGIGLLLAAVGLYGTIAYLVTQRTQEIGIRMALGATPGAIRRMMMGYSFKWTMAGAVIGVVCALGLSGLLSSLLFRVQARDPLTLIVSVVCLVLAALAATVSPLNKAAGVDPVTALRGD